MTERPCSLYKVTHRESGKSYIGIAIDPKERWRTHLSTSKHGRGAHFANALKLYGKDAFDWKVICTYISTEVAIEAEKHAIAAGYGHYNLTTGGEYGKAYMPEVRAKMSEAKKGRKLSEAIRAKMSAAHQARNERLGRVKLVFYGPKLPRVYTTGHKASEETKAKMSAAMKGIPKPPRTAQHSARITAAKAGKDYGPRKPYMTAKRKAMLELVAPDILHEGTL